MSGTKRKTPDIAHDRHENDSSDGLRGRDGGIGWWISLEEAQERSIGNEKWFEKNNFRGKQVPSIQHVRDAPEDKPVWLFQDGDMYLGEWRSMGPDAGFSVEHGFGIAYTNYPLNHQGLVCIGGWNHGIRHGQGEEFWMESSIVWTENHHDDSPIAHVNPANNKRTPVPFAYRGRLTNGYYHDKQAVVTLKDGTTRRGAWSYGEPVGDWHNHELVAQATAAAAAAVIPSEAQQAAIKQDVDDHSYVIGVNEESDGEDYDNMIGIKDDDDTRDYTTTKQPAQRRKKPNNDRPVDGDQWITLEEAQNYCVGNEKWFAIPNSKGECVKQIQHVKGAPKDKPVWLFAESGDMYLGGWSDDGQDQHGFGVAYWNAPDDWRGAVYIGDWFKGVCWGAGEEIWLQSSKVWTENCYPPSEIFDPVSGTPLPFCYRGNYDNGVCSDRQAVVTLKDGTSRVGRWFDSKPQGDWHHHRPVAKTEKSTTAAVKEEENKAGNARTASAPMDEAGNEAGMSTNAKGGGNKAGTATRAIAKEEGYASGRSPAGAVKEEGNVVGTSSRLTLKEEGDSEGKSSRATSVKDEGNDRPSSPLVISLLDSDTDDDAKEEEDSETARTEQIYDWMMTDVLAQDPLPHPIRQYAENLVREGFLSVEMIKAYMTAEHVKVFRWMKPLHREIFLHKMKQW